MIGESSASCAELYLSIFKSDNTQLDYGARSFSRSNKMLLFPGSNLVFHGLASSFSYKSVHWRLEKTFHVHNVSYC